MPKLKRSTPLGLIASLACVATVAAAEAPPAKIVAELDLSRPFGAPSGWRFSAVQGEPLDDPIGLTGDKVPGALRLCLRKAASAPCDPHLRTTVADGPDSDLFAAPHSLDAARIVHGPSGRALLLVQTGSLHSGNGDRLVLTQVLAYRSGADRFERVYEHLVGQNNNQEVRYIAAGPLKGDIVSAEPTQDAPYGFWMTVHAPTADGGFKQALRYRSATRYADGNPLAVIDSEMPNMAQRLGLWRPGAPLPLPARACPTPHLVKGALWCG
jgi:hypothetical protein